MSPIVLQHARESAELHVAAAERDRYKIITPFPPNGPDFPDFTEDDLAFGDPPPDGDSASRDTVRAYAFFRRTDGLYYDYSYGIRSDEYWLSDTCEDFFHKARAVNGRGGDSAFAAALAERRDAFRNRYKRSTVGDLGLFDFRYAVPSPISWNAERIVLSPAEIDRLRTKAVAVYEDLELDDVGVVKALIEELRSASYSSMSYDLGYFDVTREWMDPRLFESRGWTFGSDRARTLYGETDPSFLDNDLKLCYAQRFYVIRNYQGIPAAAAAVAPPPEPPTIRVHRAGAAFMRDHRASAAPDVHARGARAVLGLGRIDDDDRRKLRNVLIQRKLTRLAPAAAVVVTPAAAGPLEPIPAPPPRPGFVWVPATLTVAAHWERERAGTPPAVEPPAENKLSYKIAAVRCRILPRTP